MTTNDTAAKPEGMTEVTKDEFFASIGPRDIIPDNSAREFTVWRTRERRVVGWSAPGWANPGAHPKVWAIALAAKEEK